MKRRAKGEQVFNLKLDTIEADEAIQPRANGLNPDVVNDYAAEMRGGAEFPPILVFVDDDGKRWLCEGFHRLAAARQIGRKEIRCRMRRGNRDDAELNALKSNAAHGYRRTNADKRAAVEKALLKRPNWSARQIAKWVGVSNTFVSNIVTPKPVDKPKPAGESRPTARASTNDSVPVTTSPPAAVTDSVEPERTVSTDEPPVPQPPRPALDNNPGPSSFRPAESAAAQDVKNAASVTAQLFAELKPTGDKYGRKVKKLLARLPREQVNRTAARHGLRVRDGTDGEPELPLLNAVAALLFDLEMGVGDDAE